MLVPEHIKEDNLLKIRGISSRIEISKLKVEKNNKTIEKFIRFLTGKEHRPSQISKWKNYFYKNYHFVKISIDGNALEKASRNVEIFLCTWDITPDILDNILSFQPDLKWIHFTATGVDRFLTRKLIDSDIVLTSSIGIHSKRIAEFVFAMILSISKKIPYHLKLQRMRRWQAIQSDELKDKTVGIIGYGNIGREIAKRAMAFEMKVMATRKNDKLRDDSSVIYTNSVQELLKASDFLVVCAPLTRETRGLISESELSSMKKNACIINVSRGEIINEKALIRALKENWIAGACLDVCAEEPLPSNSPLYSLPNVLITHHSAYLSQNSHREIFSLFLDNLRRYLAGKKLLNIINKERGY